DRDIRPERPQLPMIRQLHAAELLDGGRQRTRRDRREALVVPARIDIPAAILVRRIERNRGIGPHPLAAAHLEEVDLAAQGRNDADARCAALQLGEPELHFVSSFTSRASSTVTPRVANTRATASPILLFGVLAPAVIPTRTEPPGSHPAVSISSCAPAGRCRMMPVSTSRQLASST